VTEPGEPGGGVRGRLLVVGTPIGNLGDLSPRAAEALSSADLVVAEDTRLAARLLAHLGARTPTLSFNEHNAATRLPGLLARLAGGATLALTTDAGMPAISDPGAELVAAARAAGHEIESVPGPSAVTTALALAGIEATGFLFGGFLPARPVTARRAALERHLAAAAGLGQPLVLYEAPHRVAGLLRELAVLVPGGRVAACRELTKRHEQVLSGTPAEVAAQLEEPRGEFTLVIWGLAQPADAPRDLDLDGLVRAAQAQGLAPRAVVELLRGAGVPRREAYRLTQASASAPTGNRRVSGR
jgi:16S rRNA (cytidine1402-2'-O)-methyltransferase